MQCVKVIQLSNKKTRVPFFLYSCHPEDSDQILHFLASKLFGVGDVYQPQT